MVDAGVLGEEERVELIDGVLVDMTPPSATHSEIVARLTRHFVGAVDDLEVRVQDMLVVDGGFAMPDLMVIEPPPSGRQPSAAVLVIEVSVSTQRHDQAKAAVYARSHVAAYWIADPQAGCVTVHRDARDGRYRTVTEHRRGEVLPTPVGAVPLAVADLLE